MSLGRIDATSVSHSRAGLVLAGGASAFQIRRVRLPCTLLARADQRGRTHDSKPAGAGVTSLELVRPSLALVPTVRQEQPEREAAPFAEFREAAADGLVVRFPARVALLPARAHHGRTDLPHPHGAPAGERAFRAHCGHLPQDEVQHVDPEPDVHAPRTQALNMATLTTHHPGWQRCLLRCVLTYLKYAPRAPRSRLAIRAMRGQCDHVPVRD